MVLLEKEGWADDEEGGLPDCLKGTGGEASVKGREAFIVVDVAPHSERVGL